MRNIFDKELNYHKSSQPLLFKYTSIRSCLNNFVLYSDADSVVLTLGSDCIVCSTNRGTQHDGRGPVVVGVRWVAGIGRTMARIIVQPNRAACQTCTIQQ